MTIKIRVYSDFVCPFCYLAETPLLEATRDKDVDIEWMPFELRPFPEETLKPEGDYLQRAWSHSVLPQAGQLGVKIKLPEVSPQPHTHYAHEGSLYAKTKGKQLEFAHHVFSAFFQEGLDIGDISVLREIAEHIGLDGEEFEKALQTRQFSAEREEALKVAYENHITAVPTMYVGDRVLKGLHPKPNIERALRGAIRDEKMEFCEGDECY